MLPSQPAQRRSPSNKTPRRDRQGAYMVATVSSVSSTTNLQVAMAYRLSEGLIPYLFDPQAAFYNISVIELKAVNPLPEHRNCLFFAFGLYLFAKVNANFVSRHRVQEHRLALL